MISYNLQKYNDVAHVLCDKKKSESFKSCMNRKTKRTKLCNNQEHCIIKEKSLEQIDYILSNIKENVYLEACPGSGKTEVTGIKAAYEIKKWEDEHTGLAVLSFTNNSTTEIRNRINKFNVNETTLFPHYIGTFDSWIHKYIAQPFGHLITSYQGKDGDKRIRLVEKNSKAGFLNGIKSKTNYMTANGVNKYNSIPILPNKIFYDFEKDTWSFFPPFTKSKAKSAEEYFESEGVKNFRKINPWFKTSNIKKSLIDSKNKFLKLGYATYYDIKCISYKILHCKNEIPQLIADRFPVLIIDECQDLSYIDIQILEKLMKLGVKIHLIGDIDQSIYSFRRVFPKNILEFTKNKFENMKLSKNFRSCPEIVDICINILQNREIESYHETTVESPCQVYTVDYSKIFELSEKITDVLKENNISNEDSAIIARGWTLVNAMMSNHAVNTKKKEEKLAFLIKNLDIDNFIELDTMLKILGEVLSKTLFKKQICSKNNYFKPDNIQSEIQWREFLYKILERISDSKEMLNMNETWSKWCKKTKVELNEIIEKSILESNFNKELENSFEFDINLRSPNGYSKKIVTDMVEEIDSKDSNIRLTSIHQVKGETMRATVLVSAEDSRGTSDGYWKQWINSNKDEASRLAYVGSSRPKDLLIWVVSVKDKNDIGILTEYGFEYKGDILESC